VEAYEPFLSLGVALGIGLLVGFERERAGRDDEREIVAGARTFPLIALGGALAMILGRWAGWWLLLVAMIGAIAPLLISYWDDMRQAREHGGTTEASALVVFLLGALTQAHEALAPLQHRLIVCASLGVVVTLLLSAKMPIHRFAHRLSREDVFSTLKFLVVAVVVLPLLPDRVYGPLDVLNPFSIGLMIVLIAGIGFVGYVAMRVFGAGRGIALTGFVGGLVSSTAVTLSFSGAARRTPAMRGAFASAVILASTIMYVRVIVEVAVVNRSLLGSVLLPFLLMTVGSALAAGLAYWRDRARMGEEPSPAPGGLKLKNPVELSTAIKFGLLFGLVLLASKAATTFIGTGGMYVAAFLAGLTDVDAITLSMATLAQAGEVSASVATRAIVIGTVANTVLKGALAVGLGGWRYGRVVLLGFALAIGAGVVGMLLA
jgi:uncharacterized membrane protein (DUF4010 family)